MIVVLLAGAMLTTSFYPPLKQHAETQDTAACLVFKVGPNTIVDRGYAEFNANDTYTECETLFKYQSESFGTCLYIYDKTGTLKARIINPENVNIP